MKHISKQFEEDLVHLKDTLLLMGGMIESMLQETHEALVTDNPQMAAKVIDRDNQLDQMEKQVDEIAIQILALRQPTATDLRFVTACMKICTDLERMGDIIVNICERVIELSQYKPIKPYEDLPKMMKLTATMVTKALDAFVKQSLESADIVLRSDDEIDEYFRHIFGELVELMKLKPENVDVAMKLTFIAKYLERMADHATNIAEQVVFTVKGLDIRHSGQQSPTP